ncbi:hypothetical protein Cflav_PD1994 [Pedosphaera parvula Ellin514]|uniref:Uncharacterized protein n=2 Tax=Pedosphaera TaxID=1032526 RepID=B9XN25_PEDPL|nr:hypothetical protein Cflav_PD1994 [Pedosphaera parvula Ellin514]
MMLVALVLLVAGGTIWIGKHRAEKIEVRGSLSAEDLAGIKNAVRSELRREIFPDSSWSSVKASPTATLRWFQSQINVVSVLGNANTVQVGFGKSKEALDSFELIKGTNGWRINRDSWRFVPQVY